MKRLFTTIGTFIMIAVFAFIMAHHFAHGLLNELELRDEHARIHMRSRL